MEGSERGTGTKGPALRGIAAGPGAICAPSRTRTGGQENLTNQKVKGVDGYQNLRILGKSRP